MQAVIITVTSAICLITVDRILERRLDIAKNPEQHRILRLLNHLANRTTTLFLIILAVRMGSGMLELAPKIAKFIETVFTLSLFIQMAMWLNELVGEALVRVAQRNEGGNGSLKNALQLIRGAARTTIWIIALLLILDNLGFNVSALIAGLGIGGAAIALASQSILADIFASLGLVLDKPFVVGDYVNLGGTQAGTIESIGVKTTRIRSNTGEQIVIPNSDLLKSRIHNFRRMQERRSLERFGILYETTPEQAAAIPGMIKTIVESQPQARFERMHLTNFGTNSIEFELVYWVKSPNYMVFMDIRHAINVGIMEKFRAENIFFWRPGPPPAALAVLSPPPVEAETTDEKSEK